MSLGPIIADKSYPGQKFTGTYAGCREDHIASTDHILHVQDPQRIVQPHHMTTLKLERPLRQESALHLPTKTFESCSSQHPFGRTAGAHVQIHFIIRQRSSYRSGYIAMIEQLHTYACLTQTVDQTLMTFTVEHHNLKLGYRLARNLAGFLQGNIYWIFKT